MRTQKIFAAVALFILISLCLLLSGCGIAKDAPMGTPVVGDPIYHQPVIVQD